MVERKWGTECVGALKQPIHFHLVSRQLTPTSCLRTQRLMYSLSSAESAVGLPHWYSQLFNVCTYEL